MPKRKHTPFSPGVYKKNSVWTAIQREKHLITESNEHFAHQGWDHLGDAFKQNQLSESDGEWMEQTSISLIWSQPKSKPCLTKTSEGEEDNVEISTQSPQKSDRECSAEKNEIDGVIASYCSLPSLPSEHSNRLPTSPFTLESDSDIESIISINASRNSDELFKSKELDDGEISDECFIAPSPTLINEAFHFSSQTSDAEFCIEDGQPELNQRNENASISSGSASPSRHNMLKGSEWLQSMVTKMSAAPSHNLLDENKEVSKPLKECFKKISVMKGGLAEKLENVLLEMNANATLQKSNDPSGSPNNLLLKIREMTASISCYILADCEEILNLADPASKPEFGIPADHGLGVVLTVELVQRWTICNGCILTIVPPCQVLHVPALKKSFIIRPYVIDVNQCSNMLEPAV